MSNDLVDPTTDDLSRVIWKALKQIETILDTTDTGLSDENRLKLMSVKKDAASSIINAGLKADENRFRRENKDIIEKLFEKIKRESPVIEHKRKS